MPPAVLRNRRTGSNTRHLQTSLLLGAAGVVSFASIAVAADAGDEAELAANPLRPARPVITQEVQTRSYFARVMQNTADLLAIEFGAVSDIGVVLVLFGLAVLALYIVPIAIDQALGRFRAPGYVRMITKSVLQLAIVYAGLRLALGAVGIDANSIVASLSLLTIAWSIGAATPIANATAGLCRTSEELQPGHRIAIHDYVGVVEELGLFNVRLRNESTGRLIVIPNNDFLQSCWEYAPPVPPSPTFESNAHLDAKNLVLLKNR